MQEFEEPALPHEAVDDDDDDDVEEAEEDEPVRRLRSSSLRPVVGWRMPHCKE